MVERQCLRAVLRASNKTRFVSFWRSGATKNPSVTHRFFTPLRMTVRVMLGALRLLGQSVTSRRVTKSGGQSRKKKMRVAENIQWEIINESSA